MSDETDKKICGERLYTTVMVFLKPRIHIPVTAIFIPVLKNSLIHEKNTKEIIAVKQSLYAIKHTWIFTCLAFALIFSAYTTSILKISFFSN